MKTLRHPEATEELNQLENVLWMARENQQLTIRYLEGSCTATRPNRSVADSLTT